jgi:glycine/D-amino acid oxidase-like deaminating enzyme
MSAARSALTSIRNDSEESIIDMPTSSVPLQSLWSVTAPPGPICAPLLGTQRAQVTVIGAGYTGLSAALHLAEGGKDVVVLEAADIGERASGVNGGQVIPGVKHDPDTVEAMLGPYAGGRLIATAAAAPDVVFELITRLGIQCEAKRAGWLQPATSEAALARLARRAEQWWRRGVPLDLLARREVLQLTGSARYCGGLLDRRGGTVQPLAYVRGLADAALRAGARIHTQSAALRLARLSGAWSIETTQGSLTTPCVILATNAYTGNLNDELRRTLVTVPSLQVATAPIPTQLRSTILPDGQAASDTWQLLRYFRLDAGGRLVLGARGVFAAAPTLRDVQYHYRAVHEIYPQLAGIPFEYHWGGLVAMTRDHLPHLHELAPGLLAGVGYNGRGVAMATVMGRLLARRALGIPVAELGFPVSPVMPLPLHAGSAIAARATIQYLRAIDGLARVRDRVLSKS